MHTIEEELAEARLRTSAEVVAHAMLALAAGHPGWFGRIRAARVLAGYLEVEDVAPGFGCAEGWTVGQIVELIDAMVAGGLLATTAGPRPAVVLTLPGFRALDALESTIDAPSFT